MHTSSNCLEPLKGRLCFSLGAMKYNKVGLNVELKNSPMLSLNPGKPISSACSSLKGTLPFLRKSAYPFSLPPHFAGSNSTRIEIRWEGRLNLLMPREFYFKSNRSYSENYLLYLSKKYDTLTVHSKKAIILLTTTKAAVTQSLRCAH